jgi:hypothetical protein
MIFDDAFQPEDLLGDVVSANRFESSFSLREIMEQKSINALNTSTLNNSSANVVTQAAEKSSNHLLIAALPKKTAAYVWRIASILQI